MPRAGTVTIDGDPVVVGRAAHGRGDVRVGMVHQDFKLVSFLTVAENVALTAQLRGQTVTPGQLDAALAAVGLTRHAHRRPETLSGGEQQRVAIARAVLAGPRVLLADEPTGALDQDTGAEVVRMLLDLNRSFGCALIVATHDPAVAAQMDAHATLGNGWLTVAGSRRPDTAPAAPTTPQDTRVAPALDQAPDPAVDPVFDLAGLRPVAPTGVPAAVNHR